jgi:hypothetical protein
MYTAAKKAAQTLRVAVHARAAASSSTIGVIMLEALEA